MIRVTPHTPTQVKSLKVPLFAPEIMSGVSGSEVQIRGSGRSRGPSVPGIMIRVPTTRLGGPNPGQVPRPFIHRAGGHGGTVHHHSRS